MGAQREPEDVPGGEPGMPGSPPPGPGPGRDPHLAGFAGGGEWDAALPSGALAVALQAASGSRFACPGATANELSGLVRQWQALEAWAASGRLGVIRAMIAAGGAKHLPRHGAPAGDGGAGGEWGESLVHRLALDLAMSAGSADRACWLAGQLRTRLPGIGALLEQGLLVLSKARMLAEAFEWLADEDAAEAERMILARLAAQPGLTWMQLNRLAARIALRIDPEHAERRRKDAEQNDARVKLFREDSGAAGLSGRNLPADEALAAMAAVSDRAALYAGSGAFPGATMDQLRALAYLDLLNAISAADRITHTAAAAAAAAAAPAQPPAVPAESAVPAERGAGDRRPARGASPGEHSGGSSGGQGDNGGQDDSSPDPGPPDPSRRDGHGPDPGSPGSSDPDAAGTGPAPNTPPGGRPAAPARPSAWAFTPRDDPGPPGGHGTWTLTLPGGSRLTIRLAPVPTHDCDHRNESPGYVPGATLRHLVQVRDGDCTFPSCTRHAKEADFEHAQPFDKGGRTCACNTGARSRRCHRVKQSPGWTVTQPKPGWHAWTTPAGRTYTQEPERYPF
jgi:hypothetical protein